MSGAQPVFVARLKLDSSNTLQHSPLSPQAAHGPYSRVIDMSGAEKLATPEYFEGTGECHASLFCASNDSVGISSTREGLRL